MEQDIARSGGKCFKQGNSPCKVPEVTACLAHSRNSEEASVAEVQIAKRRVATDEIRKFAEDQSVQGLRSHGKNFDFYPA